VFRPSVAASKLISHFYELCLCCRLVCGYQLYVCSTQSILMCGGGWVMCSAVHVCELWLWLL